MQPILESISKEKKEFVEIQEMQQKRESLFWRFDNSLIPLSTWAKRASISCCELLS